MISGWVTVTGPPRAICSLKRGITLPLEPSTLPKRTAMKRVCRLLRASALIAISAARLVAPITLVGLTALSVLIKHEALDAGLGAGRAARQVPSVLFCSAASALLSSISGTCLYAAA